MPCPATPSPTILVVGDSLSAAHGIPTRDGWAALLAERLKQKGYDFNVVNASIDGDTTSGGLARLPQALERVEPAIVILELGANDGLRGQSLKALRGNLRKMIQLSRKAGARVLLVGVRMPPNYGPDYAHRFHQVYLELATDMALPLVPKILAGVAADPELMQDDGHHPVAKAEPIVLDNIWSELEPLLKTTRRKLASGSKTGIND